MRWNLKREGVAGTRLALELDGRRLPYPRAHWALPVLEALLSHAGHSVGCEVIEAELREQGLRGKLSAKQMLRVWDALDRLFVQGGFEQVLNQRLSYRSGSRSRGPWTWHPLADDVIQFSGQKSPVKACNEDVLSLSDNGALASAVLMESVVTAHSLLWKGFPERAYDVLIDEARWTNASVPLRALIALRRGELLGRLRRFTEARAALGEAEDYVASGPNSLDQLGIHLASARAWLRYREAPMESYGPILQQMPNRHAQAKSSGDTFAMAELWNLEGLCLRRQLEAQIAKGTHDEVELLAQRMCQCFIGSIYLLILAQLYERCQNVCANLAYGCQRAGAQLGESWRMLALQWYAISARLSINFDLADNAAWEYIFVGELWLEFARESPAKVVLPSDIHWMGHRPDQLKFYLAAERTAVRAADPHQQALALINLYRFSSITHNLVEKNAALDRLAEVLHAKPDLVTLLKSEGYALPDWRSRPTAIRPRSH